MAAQVFTSNRSPPKRPTLCGELSDIAARLAAAENLNPFMLTMGKHTVMAIHDDGVDAMLASRSITLTDLATEPLGAEVLITDPLLQIVAPASEYLGQLNLRMRDIPGKELHVEGEGWKSPRAFGTAISGGNMTIRNANI